MIGFLSVLCITARIFSQWKINCLKCRKEKEKKVAPKKEKPDPEDSGNGLKILAYKATDLALNGCTSAEPFSFLTADANIKNILINFVSCAGKS